MIQGPFLHGSDGITVRCAEVLTFLSELNTRGNIADCSLLVPCVIAKSEQKANCYLSKLLEILNRDNFYNVYFFDCDDAETININTTLHADLKDNGKTNTSDIIIADGLGTATEDVYVSFGTVREMYEYVMNRTLRPEEPLFSDLYTRHKMVSGLISVSVLSGEKSNIIILGERHNKLDTCEEKEDTMNAFEFFMSLLDKNKRIFIDVFAEFAIQMGAGPLKERRQETMNISLEKRNSGFMHDVEGDLTNGGCLYGRSDSSGECRYKDYVKFHSTNFRWSKLSTLRFYHCIFWIYSFAHGYLVADTPEEREQNKTQLKIWCKLIGKHIKRVPKFDTRAGILEDFDNALDYLKINKQISKMKIERERLSLSMNIKKYRTELSEQLKDGLLSDLKVRFERLEKGELEVKTIDELEQMTYDVCFINVYLMDYYLLARMLCTHVEKSETVSTHDEKSETVFAHDEKSETVSAHDEKSETVSAHNEKSETVTKNCIVYVGNGHATTYKTILREMGFNIVYESAPGNPKPACLDLSEMMWPYY